MVMRIADRRVYGRVNNTAHPSAFVLNLQNDRSYNRSSSRKHIKILVEFVFNEDLFHSVHFNRCFDWPEKPGTSLWEPGVPVTGFQNDVSLRPDAISVESTHLTCSI